MMKLSIFVGMMAGSYIGWYLGDALGWGFWGAFILSGVGSIGGVFAGWKLALRLDR
jgi:outer membrane lipoprotein SlyB